MDLSTEYMGLKLKNPLVASASPLSESIEGFRRLEDAGAAAIVNYSLFEEQISRDVLTLNEDLSRGTESFAESLTYFPEAEQFFVGPEEYLDHIRKAKQAVEIPVIGSLNGCSIGGWTKYAKYIEEAGADALELNLYFTPAYPNVSGVDIENLYIEVLKSVKANLKIPVAVKLSPYFSSVANIAKRMDGAGADGLVLFNRFYQPDIDLDKLEVVPNLLLSSSYENRLAMRWIAVLYGRLKTSFAATTGIHEASDVLKMLMAGADVTMLCSVLLKKGVGHVKTILGEMHRWMEEHEYDSVQQLKGSMSQKACENPQAFERANYMKVLQSFH